jgi:hypothetical protein
MLTSPVYRSLPSKTEHIHKSQRNFLTLHTFGVRVRDILLLTRHGECCPTVGDNRYNP